MPRAKVLLSVHLVLLRGETVLLGERRNTELSPGKYHFPSGHVEAGETAPQALIREAREELGIELTEEDLTLVHVLHLRHEPDYVSLFFTAEKWSGKIRNMEPEMCAGWEWRDVDDLPANTLDYARYALDNIRSGRRFGAFGWS